jgi:hypothetical protein
MCPYRLGLNRVPQAVKNLDKVTICHEGALKIMG